MGEGGGYWNGDIHADISNVNTGNVGVFTKKDPSSAITGWPGVRALDVSGNLRVRAVAETQGLILTPIQSAEGTTQSAIINLDPSNLPVPQVQNPLLTKGMMWINKAQDTSSGWSTLPPEHLPRNSFMGACVALGGKVYVMGGLPQRRRRRRHLVVSDDTTNLRL